jgi:hypothetical protein
MYLGSYYFNDYNLVLWVIDLAGAAALVLGAAVAATAAVRSFFAGRLIGGLLLGLTTLGAAGVGLATPFLGPYAEAWVDWIMYGSDYLYGYRMPPPITPHLYSYVYGFPVSVPIAWAVLGGTLGGAGLAAHALLPWGPRPPIERD